MKRARAAYGGPLTPAGVALPSRYQRKIIPMVCSGITAVHIIINKLELDDGIFRGSVALSLGSLLESVGDFPGAVQALRGGCRTMDQIRANLVSFEHHLPSSQEDALALTRAAVTTSTGAVCEQLGANRLGAGAYGGSGIFGAGSQLQDMHDRLAAVHADMVASMLRVEVAQAAARGVAVASHRQRYKVFLARERRQQQGAAGAKGERNGGGDTVPTHGARSNDGAGNRSAFQAAVSGVRAVQARLEPECGRNGAWRALLLLNVVPQLYEAPTEQVGPLGPVGRKRDVW